MTKKRNYYTASKKSKIALAAIEGKLTQAQLTRTKQHQLSVGGEIKVILNLNERQKIILHCLGERYWGYTLTVLLKRWLG